MVKPSSPRTPTQPQAKRFALTSQAIDDAEQSLVSVHSKNPQTPAPISSASDIQQLPAYLLGSPSGSAQLSASHYTPLTSSGFAPRHPLDGSPLPATPLPGSQGGTVPPSATAPLASLAEEGAQYPSPAGTLVPPRGAEQRWSLGPVPTKVAPMGVYKDKEEAQAEAKESHIESRRVSTPSTASSRASGPGSRSSQGAPPTRPPSLPPSDTTAGIIASRPSSRRGSALPDASPSAAGMSPKALRPISTLSSSGSSAGSNRASRSLSAVSPGGPARLPSPLNGAGQRGSMLNPAQDASAPSNSTGNEVSSARDVPTDIAVETSARSSLAHDASNSCTLSAATTASGFTAGGGASNSSLESALPRRASIYLPPLKIRDFGFPDTDPRHLGARDVSANPASSAGEDDEAGFAAVAARKKLWGGPAAEEDEEGRSTTEEWDVPPSDEEDLEDDDEAAQRGLAEGLYEAVYAFEAESEHELSVANGEKLRVVGALEGGWAIAERLEVKGGAKECERGLVPEAYIEWIGD